MKKTIFTCALAAAALVATGCSGSGSASSADKAFNDSLAIYMGRANGSMLAQSMETQLPLEERAKFDKEAFLRGFKQALMSDSNDVGFRYGLSIGVNFARQLDMMAKDSIDIDRDEMFSNFAKVFLADSLAPSAVSADMGTFEMLMQKVQQKAEARRMLAQQAANAERMRLAEENIAKGDSAIADSIKNDPAIKTTKTGLAYKVITAGTGAPATSKDNVKVHYVGRLLDGTVFDSSVERGTPADFAVTQVVPGFSEGLQMMNKGSKYILYIPANLAYGNSEAGSIPPGSTLVFEVEMLDITRGK